MVDLIFIAITALFLIFKNPKKIERCRNTALTKTPKCFMILVINIYKFFRYVNRHFSL